jgi:hypothetical protein
MDRKDRLMQGMTRDMTGIEIAPWLSPPAHAGVQVAWSKRFARRVRSLSRRMRGKPDRGRPVP